MWGCSSAFLHHKASSSPKSENDPLLFKVRCFVFHVVQYLRSRGVGQSVRKWMLSCSPVRKTVAGLNPTKRCSTHCVGEPMFANKKICSPIFTFEYFSMLNGISTLLNSIIILCFCSKFICTTKCLESSLSQIKILMKWVPS